MQMDTPLALTLEPAYFREKLPDSHVRYPKTPEGTDTISVTYDSIYTWDYAVARADLRSLYERSKGLMWNAETDLPWNTDVDPERANMPDQMIPIFGTPIW